MVIIEDTRQQSGKHERKHQQFDELGVLVIRSKLPFGDYALPPRIAIDTKASLFEVANNLCGNVAEKQRFIRECKAARDAGTELVFLIEVGKYKSSADLIGHDIKLKNGRIVHGAQIHQAMVMVSARYGCRFEFCPPGKSGKRICELLGVDNNNVGQRLHQT